MSRLPSTNPPIALPSSRSPGTGSGRNDPDPAAVITLLVTTFRKVATTPERRRYCAVETSFDGHPSITMEGAKDNPCFRFNEGANVKFVIKSKRPNQRYVPLGIAFRQIAPRSGQPADADPIGRSNFYREELDLGESSITIRNRFTQRGTDGAYKFFVFIQRHSDGEIGIIDPGFENEEDQHA
jgi:hypothetical protein